MYKYTWIKCARILNASPKCTIICNSQGTKYINIQKIFKKSIMNIDRMKV